MASLLSPYTRRLQAKERHPLRCIATRDCHDCTIPEPGTYVMVRLPKNYGMYDCANVDLYPPSADPETSKRSANTVWLTSKRKASQAHLIMSGKLGCRSS